MIDLCCEQMDMEYFGETMVKNKHFARTIKCKSCGKTGTDYFDVNKGTNSTPVFTEID